MSRSEDEEDDLNTRNIGIRFKDYFKGWVFRSDTPIFTPGDEYTVFISDYDENSGKNIARIGDTELIVNSDGENLSGKKVIIEVTKFDEDKHTGNAEHVKTVGEATY